MWFFSYVLQFIQKNTGTINVCRLTSGGPNPPWAPCSRPLPCSPRCEGRPASSAETPGHPVDCQEIKKKNPCLVNGVDSMILEEEQKGATYLQPTNLGANLWIWLLKSEGLMASLSTEVHRLWVSFANSGGNRGREGIEKERQLLIFCSAVAVSGTPTLQR